MGRFPIDHPTFFPLGFCDEGDAGAGVAAGELFKSFESWCFGREFFGEGGGFEVFANDETDSVAGSFEEELGVDGGGKRGDDNGGDVLDGE